VEAGGSFISRRQMSKRNSKLSRCEKQTPLAGLRRQKCEICPCTRNYESGWRSTGDLVSSSHLVAAFPFMRKSMYNGVILMCSAERYLG
jgi:hypothetical protein